MNVTPLISVAMMDPLTACQGRERPPRKKSRMVDCRPRIAWPTQVVRQRYPATTSQSIHVNCEAIVPTSMPGD